MTRMTGLLAFFFIAFLTLTGFSAPGQNNLEPNAARNWLSQATGDSRGIYSHRDYSGSDIAGFRQIAQTAMPAAELDRLQGSIENLDLRHGRFDVRDNTDRVVTVVVPRRASRALNSQVRELREGAIVRLQGRYLDRDRFELYAFLPNR